MRLIIIVLLATYFEKYELIWQGWKINSTGIMLTMPDCWTMAQLHARGLDAFPRPAPKIKFLCGGRSAGSLSER